MASERASWLTDVIGLCSSLHICVFGFNSLFTADRLECFQLPNSMYFISKESLSLRQNEIYTEGSFLPDTLKIRLHSESNSSNTPTNGFMFRWHMCLPDQMEWKSVSDWRHRWQDAFTTSSVLTSSAVMMSLGASAEFLLRLYAAPRLMAQKHGSSLSFHSLGNCNLVS